MKKPILIQPHLEEENLFVVYYMDEDLAVDVGEITLYEGLYFVVQNGRVVKPSRFFTTTDEVKDYFYDLAFGKKKARAEKLQLAIQW